MLFTNTTGSVMNVDVRAYISKPSFSFCCSPFGFEQHGNENNLGIIIITVLYTFAILKRNEIYI